MKKLLYILLLGASLTACQESISIYENDPRIYFNNVVNQDSISVSFVFKPDRNQDTLMVKLSVMGLPAEIDRTYRVVQVEEAENNAVAGTHFLSLDADFVKSQMYVKKGDVDGWLPIVLYRTEDMSAKEYRLRLQVDGNEYFTPGINRCRSYLIKFSNKAIAPADWDPELPADLGKDRTEFLRYYFGKYSEVKLRFLIEHLGIIDFNFASLSSKIWSTYERLAAEKLDEYNRGLLEPPLRDENGNIVKFEGFKGPLYQVPTE